MSDSTQRNDEMNRSELLDDWSVETEFWGLEIKDAVENVTVEPEVVTGRPYVEIEVRMNDYYEEYGMIAQRPPADDPVSKTIQKHGLEIEGVRATTKSTSRMAIICADPNDGVEVSDDE